MIGSFLRRWAGGVVLATGLVACGCTPAADLTTADGVKSWAGASAVVIYGRALGPFDPTTAADPSCPSVATSGSARTYTGGCTDSTGVKWAGTATVIGATSMRASSATLSGFGATSQVTCKGAQLPNTTTTDGTVTTTDDGTGKVSFHINTQSQHRRPSIVDCSLEDSMSMVLYTGSYVNTGIAPTTWNGSGDVSDSRRGEVHAATVNEVLDNAVCDTEALSGTTTLAADGHTAVITYDGATSCDMASTVTWTLDGAPKGVISGISCSARPLPERGAAWMAFPFAALALAQVARRRAKLFPSS
jgi:hypothetical protein